MTKQPTLIFKFWQHVVNTPRKLAVVADRNDFAGDLRVPYVCPCMYAAAISMGSSGGMWGYSFECDCKPPISHLSWGLVGRRVVELMAHLTATGFKKGDRAVIISDNRLEWMEADMAIQSLGGITVPIFPHTSADQIKHIIDDSGATHAFVENKHQMRKLANSPQLLNVLIDLPLRGPQEFPNTTAIQTIYSDFKSEAILNAIAAEVNAPAGNSIGSITLDDIATLIYTSGTTGLPKGVILSHSNIVAAMENLINHGYSFHEGDLHLTVLPLAHVYERIDGLYFALWAGIPSAFCKITETAKSLKLFEPTHMNGVPKLWRKIREAVELELSKAKGTKAKIIKWAFNGRKRGASRWLADFLVFRKIRERLGGRLRVAMSGGAALNPDLQEFFAKIGIDLCQGYGMTETCGAAAAALPGKSDFGSCGRILSTVSIAIVPHEDVAPDLGIATWGPLVQNSGTTCRGPQAGEIWIRGEQIFKGYWNNPEATAKVLSKEGWFKTGDVGVLLKRDELAIISRLDGLTKNEGGKKIPLEIIEEAVYAADTENSRSIIQVIVAVAGDEYKFTTALIFVDPAECKLLLQQHGITPSATDLGKNPCAFYAQQPLVQQAVIESIQKANQNLQMWERIKKIQIVPEEATIEGGHLTATLKVRSKSIRQVYKPLIENIYASTPQSAIEGTSSSEPIEIESRA